MRNIEIWKRHFAPAIWEHGEQCHKSKKISRLELSSTGEWSAEVSDEKENHNVFIVFDAGEVIKMSCSCEYATENHLPCKHMAAMLCCIDEMLKDEQKEMLSRVNGSFDEVVSKIDQADLKEFIIQMLKEDTRFAIQFWLQFSNEFSSFKQYKN